ncbi:MAG TPA: helix-turn-helix transcriptional regulator [Bacteroidales bacterium]|nr:helix-turn-helix transcriptional regulator [Bacteroidales bacterium]
MEKSKLNATILAAEFGLEDASPINIMSKLAQRVRQNRLELNLTQKALAAKSGITFASLRRFENTGEISLKSLIMIAIALDATEAFNDLFGRKQYVSIDQLIATTKAKTKQRGRKNA